MIMGHKCLMISNGLQQINVGKGPTTYMVTVTTRQGSIIRVSAKVLEFRSMNGKKSCTVTFGSIVWVEENVGQSSNLKIRSFVIIAS